jgi:hypothetical protein
MTETIPHLMTPRPETGSKNSSRPPHVTASASRENVTDQNVLRACCASVFNEARPRKAPADANTDLLGVMNAQLAARCKGRATPHQRRPRP